MGAALAGASQMKTAILDDYQSAVPSLSCLKRLEDRCEVLYRVTSGKSDTEIIGALSEVEFVIPIHDRTNFHARIIESLPRLELMAQTGGRVYSIDVDAATRRGVLIALSLSSGTPTVEQTFNLMLSVMRHTAREDRALREGKWQTTIGRELAGRTLGILGLGRLGKEVARIARAFGMTVIVWGQTLTPEQARASGVEWVPFEQLMARADVVSVHWKLGERTRGFIGRKQLELMKPSAVLINTSRGPIVDEAALIEVLKGGKIAGAGLDVYTQEPIDPRNPLLQLDNVVISPHLGFVTVENYERSFGGAIDNVISYLDGNPTNIFNPEALKNRSSTRPGER